MLVSCWRVVLRLFAMVVLRHEYRKMLLLRGIASFEYNVNVHRCCPVVDAINVDISKCANSLTEEALYLSKGWSACESVEVRHFACCCWLASVDMRLNCVCVPRSWICQRDCSSPDYAIDALWNDLCAWQALLAHPWHGDGSNSFDANTLHSNRGYFVYIYLLLRSAAVGGLSRPVGS